MSENKGHESDKGWNISSVEFEKWIQWMYGWYLGGSYKITFEISDYNGMKFVEKLIFFKPLHRVT